MSIQTHLECIWEASGRHLKNLGGNLEAYITATESPNKNQNAFSTLGKRTDTRAQTHTLVVYAPGRRGSEDFLPHGVLPPQRPSRRAPQRPPCRARRRRRIDHNGSYRYNNEDSRSRRGCLTRCDLIEKNRSTPLNILVSTPLSISQSSSLLLPFQLPAASVWFTYNTRAQEEVAIYTRDPNRGGVALLLHHKSNKDTIYHLENWGTQRKIMAKTVRMHLNRARKYICNKGAKKCTRARTLLYEAEQWRSFGGREGAMIKNT